MSDMSFKQAKELVDKMELTEISIKKATKELDEAKKAFQKSLRAQEGLIDSFPTVDIKLNVMRFFVAINIGLIVGLVLGKYVI
jgi:tetrahydromethanopterin S-methyltransferase subunit B